MSRAAKQCLRRLEDLRDRQDRELDRLSNAEIEERIRVLTEEIGRRDAVVAGLRDMGRPDLAPLFEEGAP